MLLCAEEKGRAEFEMQHIDKRMKEWGEEGSEYILVYLELRPRNE